MKLNPCPFCGSEADAENYQHSPIYYVSCSNLDCFGRLHSNESLADAILKWNQRHDPLQQAMLQSLMKRYAVNGKISDVGMPVYDRECLKLLESQGVLSLSNGLYQPK